MSTVLSSSNSHNGFLCWCTASMPHTAVQCFYCLYHTHRDEYFREQLSNRQECCHSRLRAVRADLLPSRTAADIRTRSERCSSLNLPSRHHITQEPDRDADSILAGKIGVNSNCLQQSFVILQHHSWDPEASVPHPSNWKLVPHWCSELMLLSLSMKQILLSGHTKAMLWDIL